MYQGIEAHRGCLCSLAGNLQLCPGQAGKDVCQVFDVQAKAGTPAEDLLKASLLGPLSPAHARLFKLGWPNLIIRIVPATAWSRA